MKRIAILLLIAALAGCTTRTSYGECVGINQDQDPTLRYKVDVWNAILGVVFFEMIVPPVIVVANELYCPVGKTNP